MNRLIKDDQILWPDTPNGRPRRKAFLNELKGDYTDFSSKIGEGIYTWHGTKDIEALFGFRAFDFPKPVALLVELITQGVDDNAIVLDFFAGSGTLGHTICETAKERTNPRFICIQVPEKLEQNSQEYKKEFNYVSDVCKERLKLASKFIEKKQEEKSSELLLLEHKQTDRDLGFSVYRHQRSNFKQWQPEEESDINKIVSLFDDLLNPLIEGWKKEDLLTEILLLEGFPLTSKMTHQEEILRNEVTKVSAPGFCEHHLYVCLDETIHPGTLNLLKPGKDDIFVCLDSALTDELKACVQDKFNVHVI